MGTCGAREASQDDGNGDSTERLREAEERRASETEVREASKKKQLILQTLQKLDDLTDPEAYFVAFESSMAEGDFAEKDWLTILRKQVTGKALSVYQELDPAVPYKNFKSTLWERLGYTDAKARKTVWRSQLSDQQSPRNHLAPIIRGINRLAQPVNDRKGHVFEQFRGALTHYYSPEVCHSLRSKDYDSVQQMVDELEAAWESKSPVERSRMHRHPSDWTPSYKKQQWNRPKDTASTDRRGGYPNRSRGGGKPTVAVRVMAKG